MKDILLEYDRVCILNLLHEDDKKAPEAALTHHFKDQVDRFDRKSRVIYLYFNYHEEKHRAKGNVQQMEKNLKSLFEKHPTLQYWFRHQKKFVFRVNCLDCLDRTNMGQFLIIENFISNYDLKKSEDWKLFEFENRWLWDENGNKLSS